MADIRVGVRKIAAGGTTLAGAGEPAVAESQAHWVQIGDLLIDAREHGLQSVEYHADGSKPSTVTIVLICSSFATVHKDERPE